ncbi:8449_t:CDS:2 [Racocetra fulgida]|uniref:8449_t:CDS:1 n=1 Tax=Racocetra fulgida TaxID=60492 RepID=A0A9N8YX45_9GLOM|nr:8449_t:CDS:2 [Racocetra fulgida]
MDEVISYLDSLVNTINPGLNKPLSTHHPCQKWLEDLDDDLQDYFGFPNELRDHTIVHNENGNLELLTARNDPLINPHNRIQLQGWRANIDLKPILII